MAKLGLYCKTCNEMIFQFDLPFSIAKLYGKKTEGKVHLGHHVDIVENE